MMSGIQINSKLMRYILLLQFINVILLAERSAHELLKRNFRKKFFVDPKSGKFCDVIAYSISLIQTCSDFPWKQFQLCSDTTYLSKQNKTILNFIKIDVKISIWFYHETFQNIRLNVGIEVKIDLLKVPMFESRNIFLQKLHSCKFTCYKLGLITEGSNA